MKMLVALVILLAPAISGQDMPGSSCNLTILSDFPACSNSYQGFFLNSSVDDAAIDLICNNASCQMAITAYINSCDNTTDQQIASAVQASIMLRCTASPDGGICLSRLQNSSIDSLGNISSVCIQEYFMGICSQFCVQAITTLTDQLGCCYNEAIRNTLSLAPQILNVLTSDYFVLCNLTAQTFCEDNSTIAPSRCTAAIQGLFDRNDMCSNLARRLITSGSSLSGDGMPDYQCLSRLVQYISSCNITFNLTDCDMAIIELFEPSDNCSQAFVVLPSNTNNRIPFDSANAALNAICGTTGCRRRISRFANRCLPDMDSQQFDIFVLDFGCRVNDEGSCFAVQQKGVLDPVTAAFDIEQSSSVCTSAILGECPDECSAVIRDAVSATGCCVPDFARAGAQLLGFSIDINDILGLCGITGVQPCAEQMEGDFRTIIDNTHPGNNTNPGNDNTDPGGSTGGSATIIVDYILLTSLLALLLVVNN